MRIHRFEVYLIHLDPTIGSEIQQMRSCLVTEPDGSVHALGRTPADFAGVAAAIQENAARSRGLVPNPNLVAAKASEDVDLSKLIFPESRPFADPQKLLDHGPFDWQKYVPIWVETDGRRLWLMNGVTRVENARLAGISQLLAYIFPRH